jgi:hypothetical protein
MATTAPRRRPAKLITTVRLSPVAKAQVVALETKLAMTQTGVIETAIRELARLERVEVPLPDDAVIVPAADPLYLLTRPAEERAAALRASALAARGLYEEDMAKPIAERELTAFEHLNDFIEPDDYLRTLNNAGS